MGLLGDWLRYEEVLPLLQPEPLVEPTRPEGQVVEVPRPDFHPRNEYLSLLDVPRRPRCQSTKVVV